MKMKFLAIAAAAMCFQTALADAGVVEQRLKEQYPNTAFSGVKTTPLNGIYEVRMGSNIAYVQEDGRYFIFGALYDMQEQKDLTAEARSVLEQTAYRDLPFKNAITIKKGNGGKGKREFALFSDPDCPFCRRLEETLAGMDNYTVHVFLYPIQSLHPEAVQTAQHIWCSNKRTKAWGDYMLMGKRPSEKQCTNPVPDNIALAEKLGIRGTPTMIHADGRRISGALPRADLERWLDGGNHE